MSFRFVRLLSVFPPPPQFLLLPHEEDPRLGTRALAIVAIDDESKGSY